MKILQVVPYFYPAWAYGGPAKLVYDSSVYFASQGHTVRVYTSDAYDRERRMPSGKYIHVPNVTVHYFKNLHNTLAYVYNIFFTPGLFLPAITHVRQTDVVHLHDFYTPQNAWVAFWAIVYRKPYILSVHGCLEEKRLAQRSTFKKLFLLLFGRWMLRHASKVIATSPNEVAAYRYYNVPKHKIVSIGHGVDKKEFETKATKHTSRRHFGLSTKSVVVTFLGRVHKIKGLDLLVKAIAKINEPNVQFVIAGSDDGFLPTLKKMITSYKLSRKITLHGTCFGEEKAKLFKATDVFVYPSYSEGFSLGILEALAAGLPLVITTGCHFDDVAENKAGLIVEPNELALAKALTTFIKNETLRKKSGLHAQKLIKEKFSMEAIGNRLLALYSLV